MKNHFHELISKKNDAIDLKLCSKLFGRDNKDKDELVQPCICGLNIMEDLRPY